MKTSNLTKKEEAAQRAKDEHLLEFLLSDRLVAKQPPDLTEPMKFTVEEIRAILEDE